ncbi:MAG: inositol monophosphatase family protein [Micavibrio sp.]
MSARRIERQKIADIIREVAADKIIPRFRQLADDEIWSKSSPNDYATIADIEAEVELTRILKDILPGSHVVGEEAVSKGNIARTTLSKEDAPIWIVDPVDGTGNFAAGNPVFGTMVALVERGERIGSWIYQIPKDRMIAGERGGGVTINDTAFKPAMKPNANVDFSSLKAFISRKFMPPAIRPHIEEKIRNLSDATSHHCCAWEYVELMEGDAAFSLYRRIEPWDHMAGALLLEECGFCIRKWDGSPYAGTDLEGGLLNAPSRELWERAHEMFLKEHL